MKVFDFEFGDIARDIDDLDLVAARADRALGRCWISKKQTVDEKSPLAIERGLWTNNSPSTTAKCLFPDQVRILPYLVQVAEAFERLRWLCSIVAKSQLLVKLGNEFGSLLVVHVQTVSSTNRRRQRHVPLELERHETRGLEGRSLLLVLVSDLFLDEVGLELHLGLDRQSLFLLLLFLLALSFFVLGAVWGPR